MTTAPDRPGTAPDRPGTAPDRSGTTTVLLGPPCAGKTTHARLLARATGLHPEHLDLEPERHFRPFGYTTARAELLYRTGGAAELHHYQAGFEARALERAVRRPDRAILDTGGGICLQPGRSGRAALDRALAGAGQVRLLLPRPDDRAAALDVLLHRAHDRAAADPGTREWLERGGRQLIGRLLDAALELADRTDLVDLVIDTADETPAASGEEGTHRATTA